ncbi:unnamed protein product, partial [marine sediment metagenome]
MEPECGNYGAFLPFSSYNPYPPDSKNDKIFLEYSYYAIKTLKLLTDYIDNGNFSELDFNRIALYSYIFENIVETTSTLYFDPQYTDDPVEILRHTYYMIYILKELELYDLNNEKIKYLVEENVDYENIKSLYYCYKISEILDLNIIFDVDLTHALIQDIYSESINDFFLTPEREVVDHKAFSWVCEIALNDDVRIDTTYLSSIILGSTNNITASLCNMILNDFGPYTIV